MRNRMFGTLVSEGLLSVAHRLRKTKARVELDLQEELICANFSLKPSTISGWCRGFVPQDSLIVARLASYCVHHGRVDRRWAESMLLQAHFPERETLLNELFPSPSAPASLKASYERFPTPLTLIEDPLLPGRNRKLVGRESLLADLQTQLSTGEPLLALHGLPGAGYTL